MVDEAHIVSIGVRTPCQGLGIGELLLSKAIKQAINRGAHVATLEVGVNNYKAKSLYYKYGFRPRGLRKGYYNDTGEDAIIMTTEEILLPSYMKCFQELVSAHAKRWGYVNREP